MPGRVECQVHGRGTVAVRAAVAASPGLAGPLGLAPRDDAVGIAVAVDGTGIRSGAGIERQAMGEAVHQRGPALLNSQVKGDLDIGEIGMIKDVVRDDESQPGIGCRDRGGDEGLRGRLIAHQGRIDGLAGDLHVVGGDRRQLAGRVERSVKEDEVPVQVDILAYRQRCCRLVLRLPG